MEPVRVFEANIVRLWLVRVYHLALAEAEQLIREIAQMFGLRSDEGVSA